jgi:hypothetical protein
MVNLLIQDRSGTTLQLEIQKRVAIGPMSRNSRNRSLTESMSYIDDGRQSRKLQFEAKL